MVCRLQPNGNRAERRKRARPDSVLRVNRSPDSVRSVVRRQAYKVVTGLVELIGFPDRSTGRVGRFPSGTWF